jgi:hypothetical protein
MINTKGFPAGFDKLAKTADEFSKQLDRVIETLQADVQYTVTKSVQDLHTKIVERSPVDTGAYIMSHGIANGAANPGDVGEPVGLPESKGGNALENKKLAVARAQEKREAWNWDGTSDKIILYNNAPHATTIEYGGYPSHVEEGSFVKREGKYVVKSEDGFSKQAPRGVYTVSINEWNERVHRALSVLAKDWYKKI